MKILPINNILNILRNNNYKPYFRDSWIENDNIPAFKGKAPDKVSGYITADSYPLVEQVHNASEEKTSNIEKDQQRGNFLTQELYEKKERKHGRILYSRSREPIMNALYNVDAKALEEALNNLKNLSRYEITKQPFFVLGLADISLNDKNKKFIEKVIKELIIDNVNVMDENGITLLEKVMNAENEVLLDKIVKSSLRHLDCESHYLAYEKMQKYAFDNIYDPKFKEKCQDLPIYFRDIIDDIKRKDLLSLDKHVHQQMTCGFCDIDFAISTIHSAAAKYDKSYYLTLNEYNQTYAKIVLDIIKKVFPNEIEKHMKTFIYKKSISK